MFPTQRSIEREQCAEAETAAIRVLLVDDHAIVRRGLAAFLSVSDDLEVVGEARTGEEAIQLCEQLWPNVVLMDLLLPGMDGASATHAIRARFPQSQVIALTGFRDETLLLRVLQAGAIGYLFKDVEADALVAAIRAAHAGQPTLALEATAALLQAVAHVSVPGDNLTERERDVLALMVKGLSNIEIARRLVVSRATVKGHVSNILAKLGVTGRTEAVALAVSYRLVADGPASPPLDR